MVEDEIAHHDPVLQRGVEIRLLKTRGETLAQGRRAAGEQLVRVLEQPGVIGVGGEERGDVLRVEGVELALAEGFGGGNGLDLL